MAAIADDLAVRVVFLGHRPMRGAEEGGPTGPGPGVCRLTRSAYPFRFFFFCIFAGGGSLQPREAPL